MKSQSRLCRLGVAELIANQPTLNKPVRVPWSSSLAAPPTPRRLQVVSYKKPPAILKAEKELKMARLTAPNEPVAANEAPDCKQQ